MSVTSCSVGTTAYRSSKAPHGEGKRFQTKGEKVEIGYKKFFSVKGSEALAQAAQRGGECPIPEDTQD